MSSAESSIRVTMEGCVLRMDWIQEVPDRRKPMMKTRSEEGNREKRLWSMRF